jgi:DNA-binding GntR family transcriptional regulator
METTGDPFDALTPVLGRHEQVAAQLRVLITSGRVRPGTRLPSELELAQRFGVVRKTVRAGLNVLREEGLLASKPRQGWTVAER